MRTFATVALIAATVATSVRAEACGNQDSIECVDDETLIRECVNGQWETNMCGSDQYCMTMGEVMVHCMLKPTEGVDDTDHADHTDASSTTDAESEGDDDTTSSDTGAASPLLARGAAAVALAAVGVSFLC
ncbi:hypothetical protein GGF46_001771 [Coemansia sp. RSA 552]|nr:hypothetical protein GGF46_001771 [Coemansia sp. RSA 552]